VMIERYMKQLKHPKLHHGRIYTFTIKPLTYRAQHWSAGDLDGVIYVANHTPDNALVI